MPRRPVKNKIDKEKELKLRKELDKILLNDDLLSEMQSNPDLPPIKPIRMLDSDGIKQESDENAKGYLKTLVDFYFDANLIEKNAYLEYRKRIDALNLSTIAFQIRATQHAIIKILDEIDAGNVNTRLFETLVQLQNQIMQMPKSYSTYLTEMEKSYKSIRTEALAKENNSANIIDAEGNPKTVNGMFQGETVKVRGTKELMEGVQGLIKDGQIIKPAQIVVPNAENLINPKHKDYPDTGMEQESSEDDFEVDEELF